jgi:hypothetical protein
MSTPRSEVKEKMSALSTKTTGRLPRLLIAAGRSGAVCVVAAGLMAACSDGAPKSAPTARPTANTTKGTTSPGSGSVVGARKELEDFTCKADSKGRWAAHGIITNTGDSKQMYTVEVLVAKSKTATVVGSARKAFDLAPKKSMEISLPKVATSTDKGLACTPVVTKVPAK